MIQQLTSPSNYSVNEEALRLNGSSVISPSQSNFNSNYKNHLIDFEEFGQHEQSRPRIQKGQCGKKKLTIRIDESYEFKDGNQPHERPALGFQKSNQKCHQSVTSPMSDFNLISPIDNGQTNMNKYYELVKEMQNMQERLEQKESLISQLTIRIQEHAFKYQKLRNQTIHLKEQIKKRDSKLLEQEEKIEQLTQIKQNYELELQEVEEKKKEKDYKMKQMVKISQKLKNINKDLVNQVKTSQKRVRDLEKELQKNICLASQQNINKLKQSTLRLKETQRHSHNNKQNSLINGQRKSLQRKKNTTTSSAGQLQHSKKSHRIMSSTSNILTKKLMQK